MADEEAVRIMHFFFGDAMGEWVAEQGGAVIPEVWSHVCGRLS
ncbi:MAG TPA: hypothetical protein VLL52_05695 [Anaerolineae bacterium]|nr:hypothetical protein [Anaerolineae bacterium]